MFPSSQILPKKEGESIQGYYNFTSCSMGYGFHIGLEFEIRVLTKLLGLKLRHRETAGWI
jgi:hypothetical protein